MKSFITRFEESLNNLFSTIGKTIERRFTPQAGKRYNIQIPSDSPHITRVGTRYFNKEILFREIILLGRFTRWSREF